MSGISFEYFPGRSEKASNQLAETVKLLAQFQPDFQSVTYGAGGSDRNGTLDAVRRFQTETGVRTASHLTFTGSSQDDIRSFADELWNAEIRQIVALRGDPRDGSDNLPFEDTPAFVAALKECHPFEIAVACYPEIHPKAKSSEADIEVLKAKQDAGASLAITQFFFDNSVFYEFVERARAADITIPIVPGILPIYNLSKVCEMAEQCKTHIPDHVHKAFSDETMGSSAIEVASELLKAQVHDLACAGFEAIHIYTLNKVELAKLAAETFNSAKELHQQNKRKVA